MLNNEITLFNVSLQSGVENITDERLILCSCKAKMFERTYSEFDELTYALLNANDYGFGFVEFEFSFAEKFKNPYMDFYVSCFSFRMDTLPYAIKKNGLKYKRKTDFLLPKNYTKINKNGNLSMGFVTILKLLKRNRLSSIARNCVLKVLLLWVNEQIHIM